MDGEQDQELRRWLVAPGKGSSFFWVRAAALAQATALILLPARRSQGMVIFSLHMNSGKSNFCLGCGGAELCDGPEKKNGNTGLN